jgi:hypothetical protein
VLGEVRILSWLIFVRYCICVAVVFGLRLWT